LVLEQAWSKLGMPTLSLDTCPEPLEIDVARTAVVVVDMQNAFASPGGMLDLAGVDISGANEVVGRIGELLEATRAAGMQVVYLQTGYKPDLSNGGGAASPNPRKETALCLMRARPELKGQLLVEGTWDFQIVEPLAPRDADVVVLKTRYSGFAGTQLDSVLRAREIRYLVFVGIATNVCVESTLRDAYFHEYWPVLVTDGALQAGPREAHTATVFNVESFFGWTIDTRSLIEALGKRAAAPALELGVSKRALQRHE
jgi:ureidoacrylate peracid hydrolase